MNADADSPAPAPGAAGAPATPAQVARADWLRVLTQAPPAELARLAAPVVAEHLFSWLRRPEQGLVMVRARIGNTGDRFNLGEATATRCVLRHHPLGGEPVAGVGIVLGRDDARAERVAQLDALLQVPALHGPLQALVLAPLRALRQAHDAQQLRATEASRVRFFTLQPDGA